MKNILPLLLYFFISFTVSAGPDAPDSNKLISQRSVSKDNAEDVLRFFEQRSAVIRFAEIELNQAVKSPDAFRKGDKIVLNLFEDAEFPAVVRRVNENINGTLSVTAETDQPGSYMIISTTRGRSLGSIYIPGENMFYKIISEPDTDRHFLIEMDARDRDWLEGAPPLIPPEPEKGDSEEAQRIQNYLEKSGLGPEDPARIDVMIVYTPKAREWAENNNGGIENVLALSMANAQLVLDNSQVGITMVLVHSDLVDYEESGDSGDDLMRLTASPSFNPFGSDAEDYMNEVHEWRDTYGADLTAIFAAVDDTGGLAWTINDKRGMPQYGFSLTRVQQASWTYTHIHEMGHNMGLHHHKEQNFQPGPTSWWNWPENKWSAGWRWTGEDGKNYCSVMTYTSGQYYDDGITHTEVPIFSNPFVYYQGVPTGHHEDGDNARTLKEIKHAISAYRKGIYPGDYFTFHYETFGNGSIPGGWENNVLQGPEGFPGWEWTHRGGSWGGRLSSTTSDDGYMIIDSGRHGVDGTTEKAELISPAFNFSDIESDIVFTVEHFARSRGNASAVVYISTDGFTTETELYEWSGDSHEYNGQNPVLSQFDVSDFARGESGVQLRFEWTGEYDYWWLLDDFEILVKYTGEHSRSNFMVKDLFRNPVPDARIDIAAAGDDPVVLFTDENGYAVFESAGGVFAYTVEKEEYLVKSGSFTIAGSDIDINVSIAPDAGVNEVLMPGNWLNAGNTTLYTDGEGYVSGTNENGDRAKAQVFQVSGDYEVYGVYFWYGSAEGETGAVNFKLWDVADEKPSSVLAKEAIDLAGVVTTDEVQAYNDMMYVEFEQPVKISSDFAAGFDLSEIYPSKIGLVSSSDKDGAGLKLAFEQKHDGTWYDILSSRGLDIDLAVFPLVRKESREIAEVKALEPIIIEYGTTYGDIGLPGMVNVTLDDNSEAELEVNWDGGTPAYDGNTPDIYTFVGTFDLPENISNPGEHTATIDVVVEELGVFSLNLSVFPEAAGTAGGYGEYERGSYVTIVAIPESGHEFVNWTDDHGIGFSEREEYSFQMPDSDLELTANFKLADYHLTLVAEPEDAGELKGEGIYNMDQQAEVSAEAREGYHFVSWKDKDENVVSTEAVYTYIMPAGNSLLTAVFSSTTNTYTTFFRDLEIYPNPFGDSFVVENISDADNIRITDIYGQTVKQLDVTNMDRVTISAQGLTAGVYLVITVGNNGTREIRKVVKE